MQPENRKNTKELKGKMSLRHSVGVIVLAILLSVVCAGLFSGNLMWYFIGRNGMLCWVGFMAGRLVLIGILLFLMIRYRWGRYLGVVLFIVMIVSSLVSGNGNDVYLAKGIQSRLSRIDIEPIQRFLETREIVRQDDARMTMVERDELPEALKELGVVVLEGYEDEVKIMSIDWGGFHHTWGFVITEKPIDYDIDRDDLYSIRYSDTIVIWVSQFE